ncbi:MAG: hypothetical protein RJA81_20 [Planctomycetota bacterium]|jgi:molybdenum-dependent DNA-binding transcriptional regulator ModE
MSSGSDTNPLPESRRIISEIQPRDPGALWHWIKLHAGIHVARNAVCQNHHAPWEFLKNIYFDRPKVSLALGGRGSGKSFLTALGTHLMSRWHPHHRVRVLGGSLAQSQQIYEAMRHIVREIDQRMGPDHHEIQSLLKNRGLYGNGSEVMILAASNTSVRGPHIPTLLLDEVDEIASDLRESAMGMCMNIGDLPASVVMTSTWHRVGGPMTELVARGETGEFPFFRFCIFEVLERCPESRSGPNLENCSACPLQPWCHDVHDQGPPKAKRSDGHYAIDAVIQKLQCVSRRVFESDYLCLGPKSDGLWFNDFQRSVHVSEQAEYQVAHPVHLGLDSGVFTGGVLYQIVWKKPVFSDLTLLNSKGISHSRMNDRELVPEVHVFGEFLTEGQTAERNARLLLEMTQKLCEGRIEKAWTDPAGGARNPIGPTVIAEYQRVGVRLEPWPIGSVSDSLTRMESLINPAQGPPRLIIHPRCELLIQAFENYRRAKRAGQWRDWPEDPQHPHEDLIDALRCGLRASLPEDHSNFVSVPRISARKVF